MSQTIEQKRALYAYNQVNNWINNELNLSKLSTLTPKIPTMILQNGLGQTLSFLLAKNEQQLTLLMQNWLCGAANDEEKPCIVYINGGANNDLIERLISGTRDDYMRAQQEILALFNWVKKFADAKLPRDAR